MFTGASSPVTPGSASSHESPMLNVIMQAPATSMGRAMENNMIALPSPLCQHGIMPLFALIVGVSATVRYPHRTYAAVPREVPKKTAIRHRGLLQLLGLQGLGSIHDHGL